MEKTEIPSGLMIAVETEVNMPLDKVWNTWIEPHDIINWYTASEDWHTPKAVNNLSAGGRFLFRMEARDKSAGFDFEGTYDEIIDKKLISYIIGGDGRKVKVIFFAMDNKTKIIEIFEPENENTIELQREGWQAILDNFKIYTETIG